MLRRCTPTRGPFSRRQWEISALPVDSTIIDAREILAALPRLIQRYREMVADLGSVARTNPDRARECIRSILGQIRVKPDKGILVAEIGLNETPLTALAGGVPMDLVAGARYSSIHSCGFPEKSRLNPPYPAAQGPAPQGPGFFMSALRDCGCPQFTGWNLT